MKALQPAAVAVVIGPQLLGCRVLADLGGGYVPPDAATWEEAMLLGFGDDHTGPPLRAGLAQRLTELLGSSNVPGPGAEALGILCQVDLNVLALEAVRPGIAVPELIAEADAGSPHLQPADALVAMVFGDDDRDLEILLPRGHQLGRVHEVSAVADKDIDLALRLSQADAEAGGNLVAHARVAKLQMAST